MNDLGQWIALYVLVVMKEIKQNRPKSLWSDEIHVCNYMHENLVVYLLAASVPGELSLPTQVAHGYMGSYTHV